MPVHIVPFKGQKKKNVDIASQSELLSWVGIFKYVKKNTKHINIRYNRNNLINKRYDKTKI